MKEYLGLLELADDKETKIDCLVQVVTDLLKTERRIQHQSYQHQESNRSSKKRKYVSCLVPHNKRKRIQVTMKGKHHR